MIYGLMHPSMDFEITGPTKLQGKIAVNSSKNGAMGLMCAALLNHSKTVLRGIPRIEEVNRMIELMGSIGVKIQWVGPRSIEITPPKRFSLEKLDKEAASKMRSALMLIGPLIHRVKTFNLPHAGGCKMGERTIEAHRHGLRELGLSIVTKEDHYEISHKKTHPAKIVMYEASVTATENILMAAALTPGETVISFTTPDYVVQEVCFFLESLGVKIDGIGTSTLVVHGVERIDKEIVYSNSEDPIEAMLYIAAAAVTSSKLKIERVPIDFLRLELTKLEVMGLKFKIGEEYLAENGRTKLSDVTISPSKLKSPPDKIHAQPYPGINSDNLPFFVPIATQATGQTLIHDWMWENRAIYFTELNKLGARVTLADPHRAFVDGPTELRATQIVCPPALRPAAVILIAMLAAKGTSLLQNVYSINRGYEEIAKRLNSIGAKIKILRGR